MSELKRPDEIDAALAESAKRLKAVRDRGKTRKVREASLGESNSDQQRKVAIQ